MAMAREIGIRRAVEGVGHCEHIIRAMRPAETWDSVLVAINVAFPDNPVKMGRMMRSVHRLVQEGLMPATVVGRTGSEKMDAR